MLKRQSQLSKCTERTEGIELRKKRRRFEVDEWKENDNQKQRNREVLLPDTIKHRGASGICIRNRTLHYITNTYLLHHQKQLSCTTVKISQDIICKK